MDGGTPGKPGKKTAEFVAVMRAFAVIYAAVGLFFFGLHAYLARTLGMEAAPNRFWVVLTLSMMMMLSYLSWQSSKRPAEKAFVHCHLLSKFVSVTGFLVSFALDPATWGHIVGAVTDAAVFVTVLFFYLRSRPELNGTTEPREPRGA
jgi:O-antigen/teichoic acid export membrane protein